MFSESVHLVNQCLQTRRDEWLIVNSFFFFLMQLSKSAFLFLLFALGVQANPYSHAIEFNSFLWFKKTATYSLIISSLLLGNWNEL